MNEQLVVKNFGPIKDATVDFKRVTVFIGPTGGGKSTLAKLAAIFRTDAYASQADGQLQNFALLSDYNLSEFRKHASKISSQQGETFKFISFEDGGVTVKLDDTTHQANLDRYKMSGKLVDEARAILASIDSLPLTKDRLLALKNVKELLDEASKSRTHASDEVKTIAYASIPNYIPSDRAFVASINSSFAGLMRDDIGLPKPLLNFANSFFQARDEVYSLEISFLSVEYFRHDSKDFVSFESDGKQVSLQLNETASGIQSVTPLLVLLEHLSRNTEQAQSFIIEEPELNLYPTAQQGLLNWLVEKCTKGENDLTITTHSPYLLAHFNLLLYAYQVAENHPDRADDVAKIVPRESWIDPKEFAAYHVEGQKENGVRSIVNPETGLISYNGLDSTANAETAEFEKLLDINAGLEVE